MTLRFENIYSQGTSQISYLIGDDDTGTAAVIDPRPDVEIYLQLARKYQFTITHIFETHIHADFMSGSRELAERAPAAEICVSHEGGASYNFDHHPVHDGDQFTFGSAVLTARLTPGHTPEHLSYLIAEQSHTDTPWAVVTGDSLFVSSAGRPDLLGSEQEEQLTKDLYHTLYDFYLGLDDWVIIYPCHGAGSACGASIGDRPMSTIGYERRHNPFLQHGNFQDFRKFVKEGAPPTPDHYPRLKKVNARGPEVIGHLPSVPGLPPEQFKKVLEQGEATLLDTRSMLAFGGGHIEGAINIGGRSELANWGPWILDPDKPILLVMDQDSDLSRIVRLLFRTGVTRFAGYLVGGMAAWNQQGLPIIELPQMPVQEVHAHTNGLQILDVRSPDEWAGGHIPGAVHRHVPDVREGVPELDKHKAVATYCRTGYRASIAASLLQRQGFEDVRNIPGSWQAWTNAGYPTEK